MIRLKYPRNIAFKPHIQLWGCEEAVLGQARFLAHTPSGIFPPHIRPITRLRLNGSGAGRFPQLHTHLFIYFYYIF